MLPAKLENLRFVTRSQNNQNIDKKEGYSSKYKGVSWDKRKEKWIAQSKYNKKKVYLGSFDDEDEAAKQYDTFVLSYFGKESKTNGLITYEEVKNINPKDLIKKRNRNDNLPKYICKFNDKYYIQITYKKVTYQKIVDNLEKAKEILEEFQKQIPR